MPTYHAQKLDLFVGTESNLDEIILSSKIFSFHYTVYRNNRNWHGGGIFILIKNEVPSFLLQVSASIEQIWVHAHIKNKQSIIIGSVYCPPNSPVSALDELENTINDIRKSHPTARIFKGGDFNACGIDWRQRFVTTSYVSVPFKEKLLISEDFHLSNWLLHPAGELTLDLASQTYSDVPSN